MGEYWFNAPDNRVHVHALAYVRHLESVQRWQSQSLLRNLNLYGELDAPGLTPWDMVRPVVQLGGGPRVTMNIVRSMCDTAHAKIAQNKPLPFMLTEDGDFSLQQKAKALNDWIEGLFYEHEIFRLGQQAFLDATICGIGALKIYRDSDKVVVERVFPGEIIVDEHQAAFGPPPQLFQRKWVARDELAAMFGGKANRSAIERAQPARGYSPHQTGQYAPDMIEVVEAWKLPRGNTPGTHAIVIDGATLLSEPYKRKYFPFAFWRWSRRPSGFWGHALATQLVGVQVEINAIMRQITKSIRLFGVPRVLVPNGSKINPAQISDEIGSLIFHAPGMAPQLLTQPILPPEVYQHLEYLKRSAYEITGINELAASAKKPAGVTANVALETLTDLQSQRFAITEQENEASYMEVSRQAILLAKEIADETGSYRVAVTGKSGFRRVDFADIDIGEDDWRMKQYPTNFFAKTPAAKLEQISTMLDKGLVDQAEGKRLLDYPDLGAVATLHGADIDNTERLIESMIERGEYRSPEPYQDLEAGIRRVQMAYLRHQSKGGVPEDRLELLRVWMDQASEMLSGPPQAAPPAGDMPPGPEPMAGPPPPGMDLPTAPPQ